MLEFYIFLTMLVSCYSLFIVDVGQTQMIEIQFSREPVCRISKNREAIKIRMTKIELHQVMKVNETTIKSFEKICMSGEMNNIFQFGFRYPGTKWCGTGNSATSYGDLGEKKEEDKCCRQHDQCPVYLKIKQCNFGLCNTSPVTRSHCECDAIFRHCLQNVQSDTANTIGVLFFNIAKISCLREINYCGPQITSNWRPRKGELISTSRCAYKYQRSAKYHPIKRKVIKFIDSNAFNKYSGYQISVVTENPAITILREILFL